MSVLVCSVQGLFIFLLELEEEELRRNLRPVYPHRSNHLCNLKLAVEEILVYSYSTRFLQGVYSLWAQTKCMCRWLCANESQRKRCKVKLLCSCCTCSETSLVGQSAKNLQKAIKQRLQVWNFAEWVCDCRELELAHAEPTTVMQII